LQEQVLVRWPYDIYTDERRVNFGEDIAPVAVPACLGAVGIPENESHVEDLFGIRNSVIFTYGREYVQPVQIAPKRDHQGFWDVLIPGRYYISPVGGRDAEVGDHSCMGIDGGRHIFEFPVTLCGVKKDLTGIDIDRIDRYGKDHLGF